MRASSTLRGTLPGRKPGTRTCWASVRTTSPSALSNSGSSTSTLRRTRFPSIGSAVARTTSRSLYRPSRGRAHGPPGRCRPRCRKLARNQNMKFMAPSTDPPTTASPSTVTARRLHLCRRGPAAAEAHEVDARKGEGHRRRHLVARRHGRAALDGDREGARVVSRDPPRRSGRRCRRRTPPSCRRRRAWRAGRGPRRSPRPRSRPRPGGRGRAERPARAPSCRRPAPS